MNIFLECTVAHESAQTLLKTFYAYIIQNNLKFRYYNETQLS